MPRPAVALDRDVSHRAGNPATDLGAMGCLPRAAPSALARAGSPARPTDRPLAQYRRAAKAPNTSASIADACCSSTVGTVRTASTRLAPPKSPRTWPSVPPPIERHLGPGVVRFEPRRAPGGSTSRMSRCTSWPGVTCPTGEITPGCARSRSWAGLDVFCLPRSQHRPGAARNAAEFEVRVIRRDVPAEFRLCPSVVADPVDKKGPSLTAVAPTA